MGKPKKKNSVKPSRVKFVPLEGKTTPIRADDLKSDERLSKSLINRTVKELTDNPLVQEIYAALLHKKNQLPTEKWQLFDEYIKKIQREDINGNSSPITRELADQLIAQINDFN